jgi:hypothetical protein
VKKIRSPTLVNWSMLAGAKNGAELINVGVTVTLGTEPLVCH